MPCRFVQNLSGRGRAAAVGARLAFRDPAACRGSTQTAGIKNAYYAIWVLHIPVRARGRRGAEPEATSAPGTRLCSRGRRARGDIRTAPGTRLCSGLRVRA